MIKNEVVNVAISYIMANIGENLTVEEVAEHCNLSKSHFGRVFKKETGENAYSFIKRMKLEQSALALKVDSQKTITDVGVNFGYTSSNYSTAFKKYHNLAPYEFRQIQKSVHEKRIADVIKNKSHLLEDISQKIKICTLPDYKVIFERAISNYSMMKSDWLAFCKKYQSLITDKTVFFERTFSNPTITDKNHCMYDICMTAPENCTLKNVDILQGGKFAVYPFKGFIDDIFEAFSNVLTELWFPQSGYELDNRYSFDIYHMVDCETMYMEFDICIPIK